MCHAILGGQEHARRGPPIIDAQPFEGVAHMVGDGVVGETQLLADLLAGQVLADQQQDLALAGREPLEFAVLDVVRPVHANSSALSPSEGVGPPQVPIRPLNTPGCKHNAVLAWA